MLQRLKLSVSRLFHTEHSRMMLLFGVEGFLFQFVSSIGAANGLGTNLYATNLGATDSQIGMIQLVANLTAVALLLPVGLLSDRMKNARIVPCALMLFLGVMYCFFGTVPEMGAHRMTFFFIFLALTAGVLSAYGSIWQAFFGDMTPLEHRNRVYAFRSRFAYLVAMLAPVLCGTAMTAAPDTDSKLIVLRIFFYLCGALNLCNAFVIFRMRGGHRTPEMLARVPRFSPAALGHVLSDLVHNRRFMVYFGCVMFFYMGWHLDWSMWYIGQVQYVGMSEADLSIYTALVNLSQLLAIGFFVRMNEKKGVQFTFIFPILSLVLCPVLMLTSLAAPEGARVGVFLVLATFICLPQCACNLCLVQMLLDAIPEGNRSLIVSLHCIFVTLSNALMPFLGVQLYNLLGADLTALVAFNLVVLLTRGTALGIYVFRAWKFRRAGAV